MIIVLPSSIIQAFKWDVSLIPWYFWYPRGFVHVLSRCNASDILYAEHRSNVFVLSLMFQVNSDCLQLIWLPRNLRHSDPGADVSLNRGFVIIFCRWYVIIPHLWLRVFVVSSVVMGPVTPFFSCFVWRCCRRSGWISHDAFGHGRSLRDLLKRTAWSQTIHYR